MWGSIACNVISEETIMNQATIGNKQTADPGSSTTGKIICGSCILLAAAIPIILIVLAVLAKALGYF